MDDQEMRTLDMFRRVRSFLVTHQELFPGGSLARDLFDEIGGVVTELEGHSAAQSAGRGNARLGTAGKAVARAAIMDNLVILRRTARAMSVVMPGLEDKFRIPRKMNDEELLETARAFLAEGEPIKAEFLRREAPENIFSDLAHNIAAFQNALNDQYVGKEESVTAVAAIDAAIERGMEALRQLDPIVRNKLHYDPAPLAAWLSARHIERAARRNNSNTPPAPQTPNP